MLRKCGKIYSHLTGLLAIEKNLKKSTVIDSMRAKLSFKLLRPNNICIRSSSAKSVNKMKTNKLRAASLI